MMAGIRGRNTQPELVLRKGLHQAGFRYRLHAKGLPGKPDLMFPKYRAVIFVHGCFWHGHDCALFKWPSTRQDFWRAKITGNVTRDEKVNEMLLSAGWRVLTVWECALKGPERLLPGTVVAQSAAWLRSDQQVLEIRGSK
jgi:DNA mismatch endonuclease (patch repair protein)